MKPNGGAAIKLLVVALTMFIMSEAFCGEQYVTLEKGTPVFARPDVTLTPLVATMRKMKAKVYGQEQFFLQNPVHLSLVFRLYKIQMAPNKYAWVSPDIKLVKDSKTGRFQNAVRKNNPLWRKIFLGITICGLIAVCFIYFCSLLKRDGQPVLTLKPWQKTFCGISFIVLLRWLFLLIIIIGGYNILLFSTDEPGYFEPAIGMWNGNLKGPWMFTIGQGIIYLPFIAVFRAKTFWDIFIPCSWFMGFVIAPLTLVLFYLIIKKITSSNVKAFVVTLLLMFGTFCFYHWEQLNNALVKSYFALPTSQISFRLYKNFIMTGFNTMSDSPSMFLIVLIIFIGVFARPKFRILIIISALFGFACLVRIGNIFFAPVTAWLLWDLFKDKLLELKSLFVYGASAVIAFLIVFSPQLIINWMHFDSIFTFPYKLHPDANSGFEISMLYSNIFLLGKANFAIWVLGALGMFTIRDAKLRVLLILWATPTILFYLGYICSASDTTRFIISTYCALLAAFICSQVWDGLSKRELVCLIVMLALSILLVCPSDYTWVIQYPWDLQQYSWGKGVATGLNYAIPAIAALITLSFFRNRGLMLFSATFMMLYFSGSPWIFPPLFVVALAWAVWDWGKDIYLSFRTAKAPIALK